MTVLRIPTPPVFAPFLQPMRYKGTFGGRGSGKSHFWAEYAMEWCVRFPGTRGVCVREVQKSLKESVKLLIEDKILQYKVDHLFKPLNDSIITPGDGIILFQGMADHTAESVKSLEGFDWAYVEEAQTLTDRSLEFLRPTIRKDPVGDRLGSEIWFSWNPRHQSDAVDRFLRGPNVPKNALVIRTNWNRNPFFPQVLKEEREYDLINNPTRYAHIWEGEYEPTAIGAIFDRQNIADNRRKEAPQMKRIVVAVDPAVSAETLSDFTGIVVCGLGVDDRGYVLGVYSLKGAPEKWASAAVAAYDIHEADAIVAEVNQGGDMVESTIHAVRPALRVIKVRATRGKAVRAEPISALYHLGRISHIGSFPVLESQLCQITADGYTGEGSPDDADALVWGFTELFPKLTRRQTPKNNPRPMRQNDYYNPHRANMR